MQNQPYLKEGMESSFVVKIKEILASQGYWSDKRFGEKFGPALTAAIVYFQQTHINKSGKSCTVDGEVGTETWWALLHPSGNAQCNGIIGRIPYGISDKRRQILRIALSQHGIKEEPSGSNRSPEIDKYLPSWWLKMPGPPWCCFYFSWVCKEALGYYPLSRREGSCTRAYVRAQENGIWVPMESGVIAVPGDAFVMLWKDKKGKPSGHIGFVLRSSENGEDFNTIEGNCGNRCKIGTRNISKIAGFIDVCGDREDVKSFSFQRGIVEAGDVTHAGTR